MSIKAQLNTALTIALIGGLNAFAVPSAQAANVNLTIVESHDRNGAETTSAFWSSDPEANISVVRDLTRTDGEVWLIDLTGSGHRVPGAAWPSGFTVATWEEPEHPGLWNNLYINDPLHLTLESEWPIATGQNMNSYPNGFGNGVSYYAGCDFNGDKVFAQVVEASVPEPASIALLSLGLGTILFRRRKSS